MCSALGLIRSGGHFRRGGKLGAAARFNRNRHPGRHDAPNATPHPTTVDAHGCKDRSAGRHASAGASTQGPEATLGVMRPEPFWSASPPAWLPALAAEPVGCRGQGRAVRELHCDAARPEHGHGQHHRQAHRLDHASRARFLGLTTAGSPPTRPKPSCWWTRSTERKGGTIRGHILSFRTKILGDQPGLNR